MKKLFKVLVARRLAGTPLGLAALAAGWLLARRKRRRRAYEAERESAHVGHRSRTVRGGGPRTSARR
ncbi:hypothetical protein HCN51_33940 [Nonomuraea sp. FMUSA5-5]|uniref:LPXTG cell wall anchor domain-containing protein n=1 Tax=Nonomuraea composti TaxID=2720023 RepID=A0ABX1BF55_9ACTN|nr:DUF6203 family protein [Nonomuraea sp. FMUSA5-5]NJP94384.1 hypothetical protein [Nonomuraea sp. FMUSA5-5]